MPQPNDLSRSLVALGKSTMFVPAAEFETGPPSSKRRPALEILVDRWMDGVIKDPNLAPNHSFRHYLKAQLLDRDVPERISDAITGHKTPGIGRKYEHVEMAKKFKAISKLPVIPLAAA